MVIVTDPASYVALLFSRAFIPYQCGPYPRHKLRQLPQGTAHRWTPSSAVWPRYALYLLIAQVLKRVGIFATDGDEWHVQRKIASHMFKMNSIKCGLA